MSKLDSWVLWAALADNWTQGGSWRNLWFIASGSKAQVTNYIWDWVGVGVGQSWGSKPLNCGIWCYLQLDSARIELNCGTPSWYPRTAQWSLNPLFPFPHYNWVQNPLPWKGSPWRETYQALHDLQQLLHDHCNALVAKQPADDLEVRRPHEVPVAAINARVCQVQSLGDKELSA